MTRRVACLSGLAVSGLVCLAGIAALLYGGFLAAIVTSDGSTPMDIPGTVFCFAGLAIMGAGGGLGKLVVALYETDDHDPLDDGLRALFAVSALAMLAVAVRIAVAFL